MDQARIARLISRDPSVSRVMDVVFGKSDADTVYDVMTSTNTSLINKLSLMPKIGAPPKPPSMPAVGGAKQGLPRPQTAIGKPMKMLVPKAPTFNAPAQPVKIRKPTALPGIKPIAPVIKSDELDLVFTTEIVKSDDDQHTVFGWASITEVDGSPVVDRQGDMIEMDELSKAAYDYVVSSRRGGHQHKRDENDEPLQVSDMIESVVFTPEKIEKMGLPPTTPLGWWVGYKIRDDEIWKSVKSGEVTGFSVHGRGKRTPV